MSSKWLYISKVWSKHPSVYQILKWNGGMTTFAHDNTLKKTTEKKNNNIRMEHGIKEIIPNVKHSTL